MILEQETQEQQVLPPENTNENQPAEQNHEQMDTELGRSQRPRKRALLDDYLLTTCIFTNGHRVGQQLVAASLHQK